MSGTDFRGEAVLFWTRPKSVDNVNMYLSDLYRFNSNIINQN